MEMPSVITSNDYQSVCGRRSRLLCSGSTDIELIQLCKRCENLKIKHAIRDNNFLSMVSKTVKKCKGDYSFSAARRELSILTKPFMRQNPFLLGLYCIIAYEDREDITMLLEHCPGGDLHSLLNEDSYGAILDSFVVFDMVLYLAEIAHALCFLHSHGVYHGDVKPANVLIAFNGHLKLADFGESRVLERENQIVTTSGTIPYVAPEVLFRKRHRFQPDWWSFGILLCELLAGSSPFDSLFDHCSEIEVVKAIGHSELDTLLAQLDFPLSSAKDLVSNLLCRDIIQRYSDTEVIESSFFQQIDFERLSNLEYNPKFVPDPGISYALSRRAWLISNFTCSDTSCVLKASTVLELDRTKGTITL